MNIRVISVGKIKEKAIQQGINEYLKRLQAYGKTVITEVKEESFQEPLSAKEIDQVMAKEGERINNHIESRSYVIALDRKGQMLSSEELANCIMDRAVQGTNAFDFIIGGSLGLSANILERSDLVLSFSKFTFPHQLMRLILIEQVYRAMTIMRGEKYHK